MKKVSKFNAALALGSLTAAVALLAGASGAMAQTTTDDTSVAGQAAPGGGSFPGSFLVPGTNTSIKIGGFAKGVMIYDMDAPPSSSPNNPDTTQPGQVPLDGTPNHSLHGAFREHARQSNINVDARTPTAWGELDTFVLIDFFGQETSSAQNGSNPDTTRLVLAYGTLGPLMVGQNFSLWYDGDAMPETVDPTPTVGVMNGSSDRHPQVRYTYAGANGLSAALSIENPEAEGFNAATSSTFTTSSLAGVDRLPDFIERLRIDQAWGHMALTGLQRDLRVTAPGARVSEFGWGVQASGHLNTFGKDALKLIANYGKGLGHYRTDMSSSGGVIVSTLVPGAAQVTSVPRGVGVSLSYTHWWTTQLRSTAYGGYDQQWLSTGILPALNATGSDAVEKRHYSLVGNLIWSPVPQVDLGVEYEFGRRQVAQDSTATVRNWGYFSRIETEGVFKF